MQCLCVCKSSGKIMKNQRPMRMVCEIVSREITSLAGARESTKPNFVALSVASDVSGLNGAN